MTEVMSPALRASIDAAVKDVAQRGTLTTGVSLTGVDVGVGWKPKAGVSVGGYAQRLWGGSFTAGARLRVEW